MEFSEALTELRNGKKIRRSTWNNELSYITIENGEVRGYTKATSSFGWDNNIILSDDWIVEDEEGFKSFPEAINALKQGKKVRLSNWKDQHIELDTQTNQIVLKHFIYGGYSPSFECYTANDWEILDG